MRKTQSSRPPTLQIQKPAVPNTNMQSSPGTTKPGKKTPGKRMPRCQIQQKAAEPSVVEATRRGAEGEKTRRKAGAGKAAEEAIKAQQRHGTGNEANCSEGITSWTMVEEPHGHEDRSLIETEKGYRGLEVKLDSRENSRVARIKMRFPNQLTMTDQASSL